jgi:hypothetical protein
LEPCRYDVIDGTIEELILNLDGTNVGNCIWIRGGLLSENANMEFRQKRFGFVIMKEVYRFK